MEPEWGVSPEKFVLLTASEAVTCLAYATATQMVPDLFPVAIERGAQISCGGPPGALLHHEL